MFLFSNFIFNVFIDDVSLTMFLFTVCRANSAPSSEHTQMTERSKEWNQRLSNALHEVELKVRQVIARRSLEI